MCEPENLARLQSALNELQARVIAAPPFEPEYLARGHAVHFRCAHPEAADLRVDVMSKMRGVAPFEAEKAARNVLNVLSSDEAIIERALREEEELERQLDRAYWKPLREEIELLRLKRANDSD